MSLRRLRLQMRCAAKGHDARPCLVGGSQVEYRCLRCGTVVGGPVPAASTIDQTADAGPPAAAPLPPAVYDDPGPVGAEIEPGRHIEPAHVETNGASAPPGNGAAPSASALSALRELGDLHAAGVLTDAEFAAKKAELLRRV